MLTTRIKKLIEENRELQRKLDFHEISDKRKDSIDESSYHNTIENRKKRKRRLKTEVERSFICPLESCSKSYGSDNKIREFLKSAY